jgi:hypothetical protein
MKPRKPRSFESLRVTFPEAFFSDPKSLAKKIPRSLLRGGLSGSSRHAGN